MNNTSFKLFNFFIIGWIFCCLWISSKKDFFVCQFFAVFRLCDFFFLLRIANFGTKIRYYDFLCVIFSSVTVHSLSFNTFYCIFIINFCRLLTFRLHARGEFEKLLKDVKGNWEKSLRSIGGKKMCKVSPRAGLRKVKMSTSTNFPLNIFFLVSINTRRKKRRQKKY